uniref:Reverse transcriptase domain-containing protein n=1 Tax=Tanacetum cinerariifolium TaxID=118510 RepID=A0A699I2V3_TANCI|nr:hypothetical protein [Tanacetum cinerariifolium]
MLIFSVLSKFKPHSILKFILRLKKQVKKKTKDLISSLGKKFAIQYSKPENPNKLFQELLEDLKELAEYDNFPSKDRPIFFNDNEDHSVQNEESLENSSNEIDASNSNQEKEEPPQDSDIRQLIREKCGIEVCEEQKQKIEDTILELVEICRQKELYCMYDDIDDLIESALNTKLLLINSNSQRFDKKEQEVKNVVEHPAERKTRIEKSLQNFKVIHKNSISLNNTSQISLVHAIAPILSTKEPEHSLSMGYEHLSITPEMEFDEVTESNAKNLLPIPSECEVTSEDESECDMPVKDNSLAFITFSKPLFNDSNDFMSNDKDSIHDVPTEEFKVYSNLLFGKDEINSDEIESHVEPNSVESLSSHDALIDSSQNLEEISEPLIAEEERLRKEHADYINRMEMLFTINPRPRSMVNVNTIVESLPSLPIPDQDSDSQREEIDIVTDTDDVCPPSVENDDDSKGEINVVEALLIDDSIPFPVNESFDFEDDRQFHDLLPNRRMTSLILILILEK